jgi:hypothetical protein
MRTTVGSEIARLWNQGGPFIGPDAKAHGRVTVQDGSGDVLHTTSAAPNTGPPYTSAMVRTLYARYGFVSDAEIAAAVFYPTGETATQRINRNVSELNNKLRTWDGLETSVSGLPGALTPFQPGGQHGQPLRFFQGYLNDQIEIEVPNIRTIETNRSTDQDAGSCTITVYNQQMLPVGQASPIGELGQPGFFTPWRGDGRESRARWQQEINYWHMRLRPMSVLRTYQGYGGHGLTISEAIAAGNLVLTGIWFVDSVAIDTSARLTVKARDPMKLLVDQELYPPLVPHKKYPVKYYRFQYYNEALRAQARTTDGTTYDPIFLGGDKNANGVGYILSDGFFDVDAFGDARTFDRTGGSELNAYSAGTQVRQTRSGQGYYVLNGQGQVACYGDAVWHGDPWSDGYVAANGLNGVAIDMCLSQSGNGYWVLDNFGHTFAFGDAPVYGSQRVIYTDGLNEYISIESHPSKPGYWVADARGNVYSWPDQITQGHYGNPPASAWGTVTPLAQGFNDVTCIRSSKTGNGYWLMSSAGQVLAFGDAADHGGVQNPVGDLDWQKKYWKLIPQDDGGYLVLRGSGDVFPIGTSYFFGGAKPGGLSTKRTDGNYLDYTEIIKDLVLWSGFLLEGATSAVAEHSPPYDAAKVRELYAAYGFVTDSEIANAVLNPPPTETATQRINRNVTELNSGARTWGQLETSISILPGVTLPLVEPIVYGNLESTGTYSPEALPDEMFDKRPVIDAIHQIKEIVGFDCYCDQEGAFRFESPNLWAPGNFNELGVHLDEIPAVDERVQLTDYQIVTDDASTRSDIIISSENPDQAGGATTVTTKIRPSDAEQLRGLVKTTMWVNGWFQSRDEQRIMAELIALRIHFEMRRGTASFTANPLIDIGDQVRIYERQTSDSYIHYIKSQTTTMDLDAGTYTAQIETHWLGTNEEWGLVRKNQNTGASWAFRLSQKATDWVQNYQRNPTRFTIGHSPVNL